MNTSSGYLDIEKHKKNVMLKYGPTIICFICAIIIITFSIINMTPAFKQPEVFVYDPSNNSSLTLGVNTATLSGGIKYKNKYDVQYRFEYGTAEYYKANITSWMTMNTESNFVSMILTDLKPITRYQFRIVAKIHHHYFSSDKGYFSTLEEPNLRLSDVKVNKDNVEFTGVVNSHNSSLLKYAVQLKTNTTDYTTYDVKYVMCPGPCEAVFSVSRYVLNNNVTYYSRLVAFEPHTDTYYGSDVRTFNI